MSKKNLKLQGEVRRTERHLVFDWLIAHSGDQLRAAEFNAEGELRQTEQRLFFDWTIADIPAGDPAFG